MARKPKNALTILFLGDVFGKLGRQCVAKVLPELREEYQPDLVIANAENVAHGKGITEDTLNELLKTGVDFCTGGNHSFAKDEAVSLLGRASIPLIRPANFPSGTPGDGSRMIEVGTRKVLVVNLLGRLFMKGALDDPFSSFDAIDKQWKDRKLSAVIVDFHAEATSEKAAFAWYADGRASAVIGTHTHVPTADEWILQNGTAFISDVGMCGGRDTVLGVAQEHAIANFRSANPGKFDLPESGICRFNSVLIEINPATRRAINIERIDREADIP